MTRKHVTEFLARVVDWAALQPDIRTALLVGSRARGSSGLNSDIDLVILCDQRQDFLDDTHWASEFGDITKRATEHWGRLTALRVWYESGLEVEFGFAAQSWISQPLDQGTQEVLAGGYQILFDRSGLLLNLT
ncbi:MAG: nucleotidyltransferase domain-containing protein [Anaerolineales bacterium]